MYFKPRIFISSSLKLQSIRQQIEEFFNLVGANTMLYEKNLTPSITPLTYRRDILEADFIIFILHDYYGKKTSSGKSGTHEEWEIAMEANIPKHVYIKKTSKSKGGERSLKNFVNKNINNNYISYYYYENEDDLLKRIKETTFTIAKEIALHRIDQEKLDSKTIRKLSINHDYLTTLTYIKAMEELINYHNTGIVDFIRTTAIAALVGMWAEHRSFYPNIFIDNKINEAFDEMLLKYKKLMDVHTREFTSYRFFELLLSNSNLTLTIAHVNPGTHHVDYQEIDKLLMEFLEAYGTFKELAMKNKNEFDTKY